ncbi:unnamed protein product [Bursaphelenchus xylophilus]|uniref:(pine wood nematode) hypothetical protein n=1 Tax=Bursaphelenchus xylophilus TaxID=6326 RepID=A0A1I7S5X0_BURXY|nr:unnamed protein product [Bursaphelenchus xylophilus]CAG9082590.1 unnamed protein product [Bursaphelenchus xylophilus]
MNRRNVLLLTCLVLCCSLLNSASIRRAPEVTLRQGKLTGFQFKLPDTSGRISNIFLGVPFAQPPTEARRFEKPVPVQASEETLEATKWAPGCASFAPIMNSSITDFPIKAPMTSEDCLYLNVMTPSEKSPFPGGFPVLVFIHGGGFAGGNAEIYGFQELANEFNGLGVVVVTIQYRLGVFGFMSTGDEAMPGNLGLWDQTMALQWIQENIKAFGGNPNQVTVMGQNAGSASVGALSLSKHSRDLFQQAIQMSGSILSGWALSDRVVDESKKVIEATGCQGESAEIKECLKKMDLNKLIQSAQAVGWRRDEVNFAKFQPRMDGDFFHADIDTMLHDAPKKPTIQGINSQESMIMTLPFPGAPRQSKFVIPMDKINSFGRQDLINFIETYIATPERFGEKVGEARKQLIAFYVDRNATEAMAVDPHFFLTRYTQLLSDSQFAMPVLKEVRKKSEEGWPVFLYLLNWLSPKANLPVLGTYQTYEFPYIFGLSITGPFEFQPEDRKLQSVIISALVNFCHIGNPSSPLGPWPYVTEEHPLGFFDMRPNPVLRDNLMLDRMMFWQSMGKQFDFDLIKDVDQRTGHPLKA